jgi:hypothetical protein
MGIKQTTGEVEGIVHRVKELIRVIPDEDSVTLNRKPEVIDLAINLKWLLERGWSSKDIQDATSFDPISVVWFLKKIHDLGG